MTSEFEQLESRGGPSSCAFARAVTQVFDPEDQAALAEAIETRYQYTTYSRWFQKRGISLSEKSVRRHMKNECGCSRA